MEKERAEVEGVYSLDTLLHVQGVVQVREGTRQIAASFYGMGGSSINGGASVPP